MTLDAVIQLIGIGLFVAIAGTILALWDRPVLSVEQKASAHDPVPSGAGEVQAREFHHEVDRLLDRYDHPHGGRASADNAEARFRKAAAEKLEPLFADVVRTAEQHGHRARYDILVEGDQARYRLEIERSDHPHGQPLPYLTLSHGSKDDVLLLYGGVSPGPASHDGMDSEVGWREVSWGQVEHEILTFAARAFHRFDH